MYKQNCYVFKYPKGFKHDIEAIYLFDDLQSIFTKTLDAVQTDNDGNNECIHLFIHFISLLLCIKNRCDTHPFDTKFNVKAIQRLSRYFRISPLAICSSSHQEQEQKQEPFSFFSPIVNLYFRQFRTQLEDSHISCSLSDTFFTHYNSLHQKIIRFLESYLSSQSEKTYYCNQDEKLVS